MEPEYEQEQFNIKDEANIEVLLTPVFVDEQEEIMEQEPPLSLSN